MPEPVWAPQWAPPPRPPKPSVRPGFLACGIFAALLVALMSVPHAIVEGRLLAGGCVAWQEADADRGCGGRPTWTTQRKADAVRAFLVYDVSTLATLVLLVVALFTASRLAAWGAVAAFLPAPVAAPAVAALVWLVALPLAVVAATLLTIDRRRSRA